MCKPISEGGQRCAAHTRPKYEAAQPGTDEWFTAAVHHASTPSGEAEIAAEATQAALDNDHVRSAELFTALERGRVMRALNVEVNDAVRVETNQAQQSERMRQADTQSAAIAARHNIDNIPISQWHERKMVVFDIESTGVDPHNDRMVSATILEIYGDPNDPANVVTREWLINPGIPIPDAAASVHGISTEQAEQDGVSPAFAARQINRYLHQAQNQEVPILAFNGSYDLTMLHSESARHGLAPDEHLDPSALTLIDPLVIDRAMNPYAKGPRTLGNTTARHGLPAFSAHNATDDCLATARLAHKLASSRPELQADPKKLHQWEVIWQERFNNKMNDWISSQGGERRFDTPFGVQTSPSPSAANAA